VSIVYDQGGGGKGLAEEAEEERWGEGGGRSEVKR
jgi:hypothetical protein